MWRVVATEVNLQDWKSLAEVLGAKMTIFNRRRGNEVFQLFFTRFQQREKWREAEMKEIKLTPLEQMLTKR